MNFRAALLVVPVALALTFVTVESQVRGGDQYLLAVDDMRALGQLDVQLDRAVLEADSGRVLNYDTLNTTLHEMAQRQRQLETSMQSFDDDEIRSRVAIARQRLHDKEALVEVFESRNSVLRNARSYLPVAAEDALTETSHSPYAAQVGEEIAALLADVVLCRRQCNDAARERLGASTAALAETHAHLTPDEGRAVGLVLRHSAVFSEYSPKVKQAIDGVLANAAPYDDLFDAVQTFHGRAAAQVRVFRALLILLVAGLVFAIAWMIRRIRENATALREALDDLAGRKKVVEEKQSELAELNQSLESRVSDRTRELTRSHEQYRVLLETSRAIPWEMQPGSLTFSYVGPQAIEMLGFPLAEWTRPEFLAEHLRPQERERVAARLSADGERDELEFAMKAADGSVRWFRCDVTRSIDVDGKVIRRGLLFDVSAQRLLEAELRAAQKLEGIGRLASGIAHEINTPVQFVGDNITFLGDSFVGIAQLIEKYRVAVGDNPDIRAAEEVADLDFVLANVPDTLRSSADGLERIATIVRSMKEFSHPGGTQKTRVDLNANIQSTLTIARNEYKHVATVQTDFGELPLLLCHPGEINQVVLNMIVNAAHAIGETAASSGKMGTISVRTRHEAGCVTIDISDTGAGIAPENRDRLFEPFFTTKQVGLGTGQGLAIARSIIVDKHCGQISFDSELGVGTTFHVRIPAEPEVQASFSNAAA